MRMIGIIKKLLGMNNRVRGLQLSDIPERSAMESSDMMLVLDRLGIVRKTKDVGINEDEVLALVKLNIANGNINVGLVDAAYSAVLKTSTTEGNAGYSAKLTFTDNTGESKVVNLSVANRTWQGDMVGYSYNGGMVNAVDYRRLCESWHFVGLLDYKTALPKASADRAGDVYITRADDKIWVCVKIEKELDARIKASYRGSDIYATGYYHELKVINLNEAFGGSVKTISGDAYGKIYKTTGNAYRLAQCDADGNVVEGSNPNKAPNFWCIDNSDSSHSYAVLVLKDSYNGTSSSSDCTEIEVLMPAREGEDWYWLNIGTRGETIDGNGNVSGGDSGSSSGGSDSGGSSSGGSDSGSGGSDSGSGTEDTGTYDYAINVSAEDSGLNYIYVEMLDGTGRTFTVNSGQIKSIGYNDASNSNFRFTASVKSGYRIEDWYRGTSSIDGNHSLSLDVLVTSRRNGATYKAVTEAV